MAYRLEDQDVPTREALVALGSVFVELRRSRGLTQRKLAARCGLSQSTICRLETGKAPWLSAVWIARLLAGLDIGPDILGFRTTLIEDPEPGWRHLMNRFEARRRRREYSALVHERTVRVQQLVDAAAGRADTEAPGSR